MFLFQRRRYCISRFYSSSSTKQYQPPTLLGRHGLSLKGNKLLIDSVQHRPFISVDCRTSLNRNSSDNHTEKRLNIGVLYKSSSRMLCPRFILWMCLFTDAARVSKSLFAQRLTDGVTFPIRPSSYS